MKKNRLLSIILIVLAFILVPTAQAADGASLGDSFVGTLNVGGGIPTDAGWDCVGKSCANVYYYYPFSVTYNKTKYTAYCIYPGGHTKNGSTVTCNRLDPEQYKMLYYLVENHYEDLLKMDPIISDFVFRLFGVYSKHAANPNLLGEINSICQNNPAKCKQARWEAAFITTWQARGFNVTFADPGFYGFVIHNRTAHAGGGATDWEAGYIQLAVDLLKEAYDAVAAGYTYSGDVAASEDGVGQKFEVTMVPDSMGEDKSVLYDVKTVGGKSYTSIKVHATTGSVSVVEWHGTYGRIKVTPSTNGAECKAVINIGPDTCDEFEGDDPDPDPVPPPPSKKCKCYIGTKKNKPAYKYPCKPGTTYQVCSGGEKGSCYWTCKNSDRDIPNPPEQYISWTCEYNEQKCWTYQNNVPELYKPAANMGSTFNNNLEVGYETEHDIDFESGIAYSSTDVYNTDDSSIQKLDTTGGGADGEESTKVYLCNISGNVTDQSYLTFLKKAPCSDSFELDIPCTGDCYNGNCAPAESPDTFIDVEIHNCCEEGARSVGRQYALNELFCDYSSADLSIPNFALRCEADKYKDDLPINNYCEQYCSTSFYYELPGPTHSKQDRYFYWTKTNGVAGPILNQYRRCRTLIHYDQWYKDYSDSVDNMLTYYNTAQENYAFYNMWIDMIAANKTETIEKFTIECSVTWSGDTHDASCGCTPVAPATTCTPSYTCSNPHSETSHGYEDVDSFSIHYYDAGAFHNKTNYTYGELKRYDSTNNVKSYSKVKLAATHQPNDSTKYYNKADATTYFGKWDTAEATAKSEAQSRPSSVPSSVSGGTPSCTAKPTISNQVDPESKKNGYKTTADGWITSYNGVVTTIQGLKDGLDTCGGKYDSDEATTGDQEFGGETSIYQRVQFEKEPEMTFSYAAKYIGVNGDENDQEIPVTFEKVNEAGESIGECIQEVVSSVSQGLEGDQNQFDNEYETGTIFWGAYRSTITYNGDRHMELYDMKAIDAGKLDPVSGTVGNEYYAGHKNDVYHADKKFTTDARAHMTCRWTDVPEDEVYTLYPNGIIMDYMETDEETWGHLCNDTGYRCNNYMDGHGNEYTNDGMYHTYKGHLAGYFETYFTLRDICVPKGEDKGIFDDVIHNEGVPCSGDPNIETLGGPVNATCYIEVREESAEYYDCTGTKVLSKDEAAKEICCSGGTCPEGPKLLYDYKVVDPGDMFEESYVASIGGGYAHNWVTDPDGKAELEQMRKDAAADITYAPEKLTYSYTLTPRDLRAIREYNKTRINEGGYNDFNMSCEQSADKKTLIKCKSKFLEAISGGTPLPSGDMTLSLNTKNIDLSTSRSRLWGGA